MSTQEQIDEWTVFVGSLCNDWVERMDNTESADLPIELASEIDSLAQHLIWLAHMLLKYAKGTE